MKPGRPPCAACKCLRRKCTEDCVFAPYFPADNPQKFIIVHKVYGASNVSKLLNELDPSQRETLVTSLVYEAEFRLREPVFGCVGLVSIYQHKLRQIQQELENSKKELATYIGPSAMLPINLNDPASIQQQFLESQQFVAGAAAAAAATREQEMIRSYQQQQQQQQHNELIRDPQPQQQQQQHQQQFLDSQSAEVQEMLRGYEQYEQQLMGFHGGLDDSGTGPSGTATGFNQMEGGAAMQQQPSLGLGNSYEAIPYHEPLTQTQDLLMGFPGGFDESGAGPSGTATGFNQMASGGAAMQHQPSLGLGNSYEATIPYHEPHTQPQDLLLQQQHNQQLMGFHGGFDESGGGPSGTATGFNQMAGGGAAMQQQPSLGLGNSYEAIQPHTQTQDLLQHNDQHLMGFHGGFDESGSGASGTTTGFNQMAGGAAMQQHHQIQVPQQEPQQQHMITVQSQDLLLLQQQQQPMINLQPQDLLLQNQQQQQQVQQQQQYQQQVQQHQQQHSLNKNK